MCHHIIDVLRIGNVSNGSWTFHGVPCVIILMVEILMIEINPIFF
jgi:hypothetical protein